VTIRAIVGASLIGFTSHAAFGQAPAGPAFDVASVKASKMTGVEGGKGRDSIESSPAGLTMRNVSLSSCLQWAYDIKEYQVSGPSWLGSDRFDIVAKAAGPAPDDQMKLMMQTLLSDRFKLTLHREKKELQVYAMVQGKNPPKLRPSDENSGGGAHVAGDKVTFSKMSMGQLADLLSRQMDRPVLDMTGLQGLFDFSVDTSTAEGSGEGKDANPMVKAKMALGRSLLPLVQEQLGLKVEGRKLPADVLIIDHAERAPTEN
jgi:uncharacterized protein (TIGR03435 family)